MSVLISRDLDLPQSDGGSDFDAGAEGSWRFDMLSDDLNSKGTWDSYRALYIHIPFCKTRCKYCDFTTRAIGADAPEIDAYVDTLISQIRAYSNAELLGSLETVYIGGGTPSHIGNRRLSSLLYALSVSMHLTPEVECTLEANPESLNSAMVKDLFALGVTRLSLGVQSFDDDLLMTLGRAHDADQAKRAIECAQQRFENVSIDLMCGLPGQTLESFRADLDEALALGVKHISVYPLMIEEGTPFSLLVDSGQIVSDEDIAVDCMRLAADRLSSRGMHRYEVASYAYPGFESRHNSAYWTAKPYLGLGHGAVGMRQNELVRQRFSYDEGVIEELDIFEMAAEDLMLSMRMSKGIAEEDLEIISLLLPQAPSVIESLERDGYVVRKNGRVGPTEKGWLFGNHLYGRILEMAP